jgi:hypothetical protein
VYDIFCARPASPCWSGQGRNKGAEIVRQLSRSRVVGELFDRYPQVHLAVHSLGPSHSCAPRNVRRLAAIAKMPAQELRSLRGGNTTTDFANVWDFHHTFLRTSLSLVRCSVVD